MGVMCEITSCQLMRPTGDTYYYERAQNRGADYGHPLGLEQVEISEQGHARWNKEKAEVADQKIGHARHMAQAYHLALQCRCQQQHAYDARRDRNARQPHYKLSRGEEKKDDRKLENQHIWMKKVIRPSQSPRAL